MIFHSEEIFESDTIEDEIINTNHNITYYRKIFTVDGKFYEFLYSIIYNEGLDDDCKGEQECKEVFPREVARIIYV